MLYKLKHLYFKVFLLTESLSFFKTTLKINLKFFALENELLMNSDVCGFSDTYAIWQCYPSASIYELLPGLQLHTLPPAVLKWGAVCPCVPGGGHGEYPQLDYSTYPSLSQIFPCPLLNFTDLEDFCGLWAFWSHRQNKLHMCCINTPKNRPTEVRISVMFPQWQRELAMPEVD